MSEEMKKEINLTDNAKKILDMVKQLSVLELADLVKAMEEEFGVSASAPMAFAPMQMAGAVETAPEKTSFDVELTSSGDNKIGVIKVVKSLTGLGLKEAKDMVDGVPSMIKPGVAKDEAEKMKKELEEAGAKVTLK